MIPEAAVSAALKEWGVGGEVPRNIVTMILEAAAPHMLAEAWDAGSRQGYREGADGDLILPPVSNPYRRTK